MEFKNWKNYTADEICVLYTLAKVTDRSHFVRRMVNEKKIKFVAATNTYDILDQELKAYLDGQAESVRNETMSLPRKLMDVFPEGSKRYNAGTLDNPRLAYKSWRGNEVAVRKKLDALFRFAGRVIEDDVLVEAAKRYVSSFNGDYTFMRILPYFIIKNTPQNGLESELLNYVEAVESGTETVQNRSSDWTSSVV